jgi:F0F1-type ATP synthase alpha subunit
MSAGIFSSVSPRKSKDEISELMTTFNAMSEILKQRQYNPIPQPKQVAIIYAAGSGLLDKVPVKNIASFEEKLFAKLDNEGKDIMEAISKTGQLEEVTENKLKALIVELVEMEEKVEEGTSK